MKTELFLSLLSSLLSPQAGETGAYHKYTWKDNWVNVSIDTPLAGQQTNNRLYVGTRGMVDNVEKIILRIDRTGTSLLSNDQYRIDHHISVDCLKKEFTTVNIEYRDLSNVVTANTIEKPIFEEFEDSHLFGAVCATRALYDVLVNTEVKSFDTCDFRQQQNGKTHVKLVKSEFNFPVRWKLDTCKAVKSAVWLYGSGQVEAAKLRLAWAPPLAIRINGLDCKGSCDEYYQSRFFTGY
jgi:hypothetical protein